jgi:Carboxypeptidase regulatory-like domain/TonB dependent receptor
MRATQEISKLLLAEWSAALSSGSDTHVDAIARWPAEPVRARLSVLGTVHSASFAIARMCRVVLDAAHARQTARKQPRDAIPRTRVSRGVRLSSVIFGLVGMSMVPSGLLAQAIAVSGAVNDESGAALPGANVSLVRQDREDSRTTISNSDGTFTFEGVSPAIYALKVHLNGFEDYQKAVTIDAQLAKPLNITLRLAGLEQEVTVEADAAEEPISSPATTKVDDEFLGRLPVDSGDVMSVIGRFISPAAQSATGASIVVDGVQGDQLDVPSSAISKIRIDRSPYSALYQHPGKARVEVTTERGHRTRYDGGFAMSGSSSAFTARNAFAKSDPDASTRLLQPTIGGAFPGKRASFYLSAERLERDETAIVNAVTLAGPVIANVPAARRNDSVFTRLQWWVSPRQSVFATYAYAEHTSNNRGAGGFNLPDHVFAAGRIRHKATLSFGALLPPNWQNNLLATITKEDERTGSIAGDSALVVDHAFASGPAQTFTGDNRRTFDLEDTVRYYGRRGQLVLVGGRFRADLTDAFDASNFGGTFEFGSLSQFAIGRPLFFRLNRGDPNVAFSVYGASGFVQDEIRVKPQLALTLGLRYDWQSTTHDLNNFAPRAGFVFAVDKAKKTVIRGGAGVFYDNWPRSVTERSLLFDGRRLSDVVISNPSFPNPYSSGRMVSPLPSVVRLASDIESPSLSQTSIDVERELWRKNWVTVEYAYLHSTNLLRSRNTNAPLRGTGMRPDSSVLNVNQIESTAFERSHALTVTWRGRVTKVFEPYAQYVLSSATDDGSGPFSLPANSYDLRLERGPADFDWRHRFNLMGTFILARGFQSGVVLSALSGAPFNVTTGFDDNGDTVANDRPVGVFRNSGRGPRTVQLDIRVSKGFDIARFLGGSSSRKRDRVDLTVDVFNALNTTNITSVVGVLSSPFFGRGNSAAQARTGQVSVRYSFRR